MTITQTVEIPASHRLVIDVPREVPAGKAVLTYTPAHDAAEAVTPCPFCAAHRDPVTGNPLYKQEVYDDMQETDDMLAGKIPSTLREFHTLAEMLEDLERDDPDDDMDD